MRCVADPELAGFAEQVLPHLLRDPVRHNLACTIIDGRHAGRVPVEPDAVWLRVLDEQDRLVTAALWTPPFPLLLTDGPPAAVDVLADHLLATRPDLPRVGGPVALSSRFADRWSAVTGRTATVVARARMFRLDALRPPQEVAGQLRPARDTDRELLVGWVLAFHAEAGPDQPAPDADGMVDRALARGDALWLWEVAGAPVSMLATTVPVAGVVRVTSVYTPPAARGNGYASAAVAAGSQRALDQGAEACMLYTDLTNPTSNKIYQAIGYRPVGDATMWQLGPH